MVLTVFEIYRNAMLYHDKTAKTQGNCMKYWKNFFKYATIADIKLK